MADLIHLDSHPYGGTSPQNSKRSWKRQGRPFNIFLDLSLYTKVFSIGLHNFILFLTKENLQNQKNHS
jgi:hypothetical protein